MPSNEINHLVFRPHPVTSFSSTANFHRSTSTLPVALDSENWDQLLSCYDLFPKMGKLAHIVTGGTRREKTTGQQGEKNETVQRERERDLDTALLDLIDKLCFIQYTPVRIIQR